MTAVTATGIHGTNNHRSSFGFGVQHDSDARPKKQTMRDWHSTASQSVQDCTAVQVRLANSDGGTDLIEYTAADDAYTVYRDGLPIYRHDANGECTDSVALADSI